MTSWLLLHGFAGGSETWSEVQKLARLDSPEVPRLAGHELPGEPPIRGESFEDEVARLALLCPNPVAVCGYSLGGRLALGLACERPDLVERLVLVGANPGLRSEEARHARAEADERWASLLENDKEEFFVRWLEQPLFASQRRLEAERLAPQESLRSKLSTNGLSHAMRQMSLARMPSYWERLAAIRVPVDLIVGADDGKFTTLAKEMSQRLPQGRVQVVDGVGHNVVLEAPEAVVEVLRESPS